MEEYVASNIGEFAEAICGITRTFGGSMPWWRGHAEAEWSLVPHLYRAKLGAKEVYLNHMFMAKAKVRHPHCPGHGDHLPWLFLMQHYGLPTRLLDWSESSLVALYFAVANVEHDALDATVWALHHRGLSEPHIDEYRQILGRLAAQAFGESSEARDTSILPVLAEHSDPRHMMQQAAFTIHGSDTSIEELLANHGHLARIHIPKDEAKKSFRQMLRHFGLSRATLFPDLENLATDLSTLKIRASAQQQPAHAWGR